MNEAPQLAGIAINPEDWDNTPVSIQPLVVHLIEENQGLPARVRRIEKHLGQNSQNSSKPPSQDGFRKKAPPEQAKTQKKRGGQAGHAGHQPQFYEVAKLFKTSGIIASVPRLDEVVSASGKGGSSPWRLR